MFRSAPLQYLLFSRGLAVSVASTLGLRASNVLVKAGPGVGELGPIPTLLTGMYAVAAVRQVRLIISTTIASTLIPSHIQIYWITFTNTYEFPFGQSAQVVLYNLFVDTFNTVSAVHAITSASNAPTLANITGFGSFIDALGWKQWTGIGMFAIGLLMETLSEESRKAFKKDPKNKGKIDDTGLWSLVRHPNYTGYTLWRSGVTLATVRSLLLRLMTPRLRAHVLPSHRVL